ncbi:MAG TPA: hypothetical protein PLX97_06830 [Gemmatales bacterium]|nr:hypothetical protein [Gemmatales bacterium]
MRPVVFLEACVQLVGRREPECAQAETGAISAASRGMLAQFERDFLKQQERGELPSNKELLRQAKQLEEQFKGKSPATEPPAS